MYDGATCEKINRSFAALGASFAAGERIAGWAERSEPTIAGSI
jgi:hypothetical protein